MPKQPEQQQLTYGEAHAAAKVYREAVKQFEDDQGVNLQVGVGVANKDDSWKVAIRLRERDTEAIVVTIAERSIPGIPLDIEFTGPLRAA